MTGRPGGHIFSGLNDHNGKPKSPTSRAKAREKWGTQIGHTREKRATSWYGSFVTGYVVMPEHVYFVLSEPERGKLSLFIQIHPHGNVILSED